ncbi:hypothetical protein [Pseudomonas sp.]|uniref:hypothetical protein n=1 Tax=Pseudomonas sp. TaxID=306 RepID=UPI0028A6F9C8|nr:hypothetical protein [Pseudomonas sp.]
MSATDKKYDTLVVEGLGNEVPRVIGEMRVAAWASGHALDAKLEMEDFIRELSYGVVDDPQQEAIELMERQKWA